MLWTRIESPFSPNLPDERYLHAYKLIDQMGEEAVHKKSYIANRIRGLGYAIRGVAIMLKSEQNSILYAALTILIVGFGIYAGLSANEWCWVTFAIISVWAAEAFNTAIEYLTDHVSPEIHPAAGKVKDVAAGAVLITGIGAAIIGVLILGPHLVNYE
jgi:diacylglycerol kinase (ATP)